MDQSWYDEHIYGASQDPVQTTMMEVRFHMMTDAENRRISHVDCVDRCREEPSNRVQCVWKYHFTV